MQLIHNAIIYTVNPQKPLANAMVFEGDTIVTVGDYNEIKKGIPSVNHIDLKGKTILPGFFDAHAHLWKIGDLLTFNLDLRGVTSIKEIQVKLKEFSKNNPDLKWIRARGFNDSIMEEGRLPTKEDIDCVITDKPVFLQRTCAHIATLNSKAIEVCGINSNTKVPYGGMMDLDSLGIPNGILRETALGLALKHFPKITDADYEKMILAACDAFIKVGVTSVSDPAVMPDLLAVYKKMDAAGKLPIRIHAFPIVIPDGDDTPLPIPEKYHSDKLVINTVKFFSDGGLSGQTAALSKTYKNSKSKGILRLNKEVFFKAALEAQRKGFQIATHAIGDVAIDLVLDIYEQLYKNNPNAPKHRIEHLGLPTKIQLKRIEKMGIHIVTQPIFIKELGKNFRETLTDEYLEVCYPFKSMFDHNINVAFSTDGPVVKDIRPLSCIEAAINRKDINGYTITAKESVSLEQAIYAYTMGSAIASSVAKQQGSLQKGKKTDFIVLADNLFKKEVSKIEDIVVEQVWVNGVQIYS
ncbi:amidohydrolase [Maribacter sp. Asnod1-A12]|uniref:amidohydrolase n=1 Tax=Maribacter sp. Asnod1-A12 TaxID=3160576 RepID=UPI00386FDDE8